VSTKERVSKVREIQQSKKKLTVSLQTGQVLVVDLRPLLVSVFVTGLNGEAFPAPVLVVTPLLLAFNFANPSALCL